MTKKQRIIVSLVVALVFGLPVANVLPPQISQAILYFTAWLFFIALLGLVAYLIVDSIITRIDQ